MKSMWTRNTDKAGDYFCGVSFNKEVTKRKEEGLLQVTGNSKRVSSIMLTCWNMTRCFSLFHIQALFALTLACYM